MALAAVFVFNAGAQQLQNGGLESWTSGTADNWHDIDELLLQFGATTTLVTQETNAANVKSGTSSAKIMSDSVVAGGQALSLPGVFSLGPVTYGGPSVGIVPNGIPYTGRPDSIKFSYKYTPQPGDTGLFIFSLTKNGQQVGGLAPGYGIFLPPTPNFISVTLPWDYVNSNTPDTLSIVFISSFKSAKKGSTMWVDDISLVFNTACTAPTAPTAATAGQATINQGQTTTLSVSGTVNNGTWNWYTGSCGGTSVGTGATLAVTPTSTTTYYVRGEGCGTTTACAQVTVTVVPVGVNEVATVTFSVFPNPATDVLTVNADQNLEGFSFEVLDITGRVLSKTQLNGQTSTINITDLAKGNYIYKIADKNNQLVTQNKFVIVK